MFFEIEQFVALNLYELGEFAADGRRVAVDGLVRRYNEIVGGSGNRSELENQNPRITERKEGRSRTMRAVQEPGHQAGNDCAAVWRMVWATAIVLHRNDLPGKPDLAFPTRRKVIFVHGWLLAPAPLCARRADSEVEPGLLDPEAPTQQATRCRASDSFTRDGLGRAGDLGMRDGRNLARFGRESGYFWKSNE